MKIENEIAKRIGLANFSTSGQVIRDDRGFRTNELEVTYCWIIHINIQLGQRGGIFGCKLEKNSFREHHNPEALIFGIYIKNESDDLIEFYFQKRLENLTDPIKSASNFNLFDAGDGFTLDGIVYDFRILSNNIDSRLTLSNPHSPEFKTWEEQVFSLWKEISVESNNQKLIDFLK